MQQKETEVIYLAPQAEVIEIQTQGMLCVSGNQEYQNGSWNW